MRTSSRSASQLRAEGWSPCATDGGETSLSYALAGVPLVVPVDAAAGEVYAPSWAHELLQVLDHQHDRALTQQAVSAVCRAADPDSLAGAFCSAALLGGEDAVRALIHAKDA